MTIICDKCRNTGRMRIRRGVYVRCTCQIPNMTQQRMTARNALASSGAGFRKGETAAFAFETSVRQAAAANFTTEQMAEIAGVKRDTIRKVLRGQSIMELGKGEL